MGNINIFNNKKEEINNNFNNYYCKKCLEIPLLNFYNYKFDIICPKHQILNAEIEDFYNFIDYNHKCNICNIKYSENENCFYCNQCEKNYCIKCLKNHNEYKNESHVVVNIKDKNIKCKLHNQKFVKFCLKCKINLCELCQIHDNHYVESFKDLYPSSSDLKQFNKLVEKILNLKNDKLIKVIKIKKLLIENFSIDNSNYYYIININNIIKCTTNNVNNENQEINIKYINDIKPKNDINNIENKIIIKSLNKKNINDFNSITWCMKKLNDIKINSGAKLQLIAIGGSNHKILILNILNFNIYQILEEHESTVYSLAQYKDDTKFLFSSSNDRYINIYKLNSEYQYALVQKLKKDDDKTGGEINKVVCLSNKLLVSGDHRSITIWKLNEKIKNRVYYEDFNEIIVGRDTCHLLEVNPSVFVATQYTGDCFQVYKNDGKIFPLIGELNNIKNHGSTSNGLSRINDKLVCCAGSKSLLFYIICIEPLEVVQKFRFYNNIYLYYINYYIYVTKDNYLYCKGINKEIFQYKIIYNDEDKNFEEIVEIGKYNYKNIQEKAILPLDDGRIIFVNERDGERYYQMIE